MSLLGVNLSGAEFGGTGGKYGWNYTYPTHAEIDYVASKDLNVIRLPFRWERLQPTLGGALDAAELSHVQDIVTYAAAKGISVVLDPHDFGGYRGNLIGSSAVPNAAFADFWGKLSAAFRGSSNVIFGLMNEPHTQTATAWLGAANAAIAAIRESGATQEILVPGSYWDGGSTWTTSDNAAVIGTGVVDPLHNYAFEIHQYLDQWSSGTQAAVVSTTIGVERLRGVTAWAEQHGAKLFLGEFAVAQDAKSLTALDSMLSFMSQHADAWQGATYWGAGPWWGNYMYSIEPAQGVDKPQMGVLQSYAPSTDPAAGGPTPPAPAVTIGLQTDSGRSATDRVTKFAVITGHGDANSVVNLTIDGQTRPILVSTDATGTWTRDLTGLADGRHSVAVAASNVGGTTTASLAFTLDTTAPGISFATRAGPVTAAAQMVMGSAEAGSTVQLFDNGHALGAPVTVAGTRAWSADVVLPTSGANGISAAVTDLAGNTATSTTLTLFLNNAPVFASGGGGATAVYDAGADVETVATIRATDPDASDHVNYALLDGRRQLVSSTAGFAIDANTGVLSFEDHPSLGVHSVAVAATDEHGTRATQTVRVNVSQADHLSALGWTAAQQTFVVEGSQPAVRVDGFRPADLGGVPHSVLQLAHGLFDHADAGLSGSGMASLLASHTAQSGADTILVTDHSQSITLGRVDRQTLLAHPGDVSLT